MHEGRVVEQGTHQELLAQGGRYSQLWRAQSAESTVTAESRRLNHLNGHDRHHAAV